MDRNGLRFNLSILLACVLLLAGCNLPAAPAIVPDPEASSDGLQVRFVNLTDGSSIEAVMVSSETDSVERPLVVLQFEVTGGAAMGITLTANGLTALDETNRISGVDNLSGTMPFTGELRWSPLGGAGDYTLVATVVDADKQIVEQTLHIIVTGVPAFTPTPPPLDQVAAVSRISEIIQQVYGADIPQPSVQRFDFPNMPNRSRWIGAAYYQGQRYYIELYDDGHYELSHGTYTDPAHKSNEIFYVYCKPSGLYRVLILFVDYGNVPGVDRETVLAQVPIMTDWLNQQYAAFASSQGQAAPMRVEADSAFIDAPPSPGNLLKLDEIRSLTGFNASEYNYVIQIDIDQNNTYANTYWPGVFPEVGGGIALQGCGSFENPQDRVNIWSGLADPGEVQGALFMDLSHEMSHLFGMMDSWPFSPGAFIRPDGTPGDDWIPYVMFGWTDADGDGIIEITDPTPYGTTGP